MFTDRKSHVLEGHETSTHPSALMNVFYAGQEEILKSFMYFSYFTWHCQNNILPPLASVCMFGKRRMFG